MDPPTGVTLGIFIFTMQLGFAMLETGHARVANSLSVMMKNIIDACVNVLMFWAMGYAIAFGTDAGDGLLGISNFFLRETHGHGGLSFFIQWGFSINASTIFGGSVAGRSRFIAYTIITAGVAGVIYPPVVHWVWGSGYLSRLGKVGFFDFSGSGVVHALGGTVGLVGALFTAPRINRFLYPPSEDDEDDEEGAREGNQMKRLQAMASSTEPSGVATDIQGEERKPSQSTSGGEPQNVAHRRQDAEGGSADAASQQTITTASQGDDRESQSSASSQDTAPQPRVRTPTQPMASQAVRPALPSSRPSPQTQMPLTAAIMTPRSSTSSQHLVQRVPRRFSGLQQLSQIPEDSPAVEGATASAGSSKEEEKDFDPNLSTRKIARRSRATRCCPTPSKRYSDSNCCVRFWVQIAWICGGCRACSSRPLLVRHHQKDPLPHMQRCCWRRSPVAVNTMDGHNPVLAAMGSLMLWIGWYGFNTAPCIDLVEDAQSFVMEVVLVNTSLAAAAACLPSFFVRRARGESYDLLLLCNTLIGGLVSITAPCAVVESWAAVIIGCTSGFLYMFSARCIKLASIDDPLDAFSVHCTCGAWGVISVGLFASNDLLLRVVPTAGDTAGLFYGGGGGLLWAQVAGIAIIIAWTAVLSVGMMWTLAKLQMLRVDEFTEHGGVDLFKHGSEAYPEFALKSFVTQTHVQSNPFMNEYPESEHELEASEWPWQLDGTTQAPPSQYRNLPPPRAEVDWGNYGEGARVLQGSVGGSSGWETRTPSVSADGLDRLPAQLRERIVHTLHARGTSGRRFDPVTDLIRPLTALYANEEETKQVQISHGGAGGASSDAYSKVPRQEGSAPSAAGTTSVRSGAASQRRSHSGKGSESSSSSRSQEPLASHGSDDGAWGSSGSDDDDGDMGSAWRHTRSDTSSFPWTPTSRSNEKQQDHPGQQGQQGQQVQQGQQEQPQQPQQQHLEQHLLPFPRAPPLSNITESTYHGSSYDLPSESERHTSSDPSSMSSSCTLPPPGTRVQPMYNQHQPSGPAVDATSIGSGRWSNASYPMPYAGRDPYAPTPPPSAVYSDPGYSARMMPPPWAFSGPRMTHSASAGAYSDRSSGTSRGPPPRIPLRQSSIAAALARRHDVMLLLRQLTPELREAVLYGLRMNAQAAAQQQQGGYRQRGVRGPALG